jgi:hypothetical protein
VSKYKRTSQSPQGLRGNSRLPGQLSASQLRRKGAVQRTALAHDHTGAFGSFRRPKLVGVSDTVAYSNRMSAKAARRAEREWRKSLPKGATV